MPNLVITYYQLMTAIVISFFLFVAGKVGGTFLSELTRKKMNPPKESAHGTEEKCGNCPAYMFAVNDFKKLADRLGEGDKKFTDFGNKLETLTKSVNELTETIDQRRNEEVIQLRETVKEKKRKIEDLEKKLSEPSVS